MKINKKIAGISAATLLGVLAIGAGAFYSVGQQSYRNVIIAQIQATSIEGRVNEDTIVAKVNKKQSLNPIDAIKTGITSVFQGEDAVKNEQSSSNETKKIVTEVKEEIKAEKANESKTDSAEETANKPSDDNKKIKEAEEAVQNKKSAGTVKGEFKNNGLDVSDKEAQEIADEANLANIIQLNVQRKFPKDILALSEKRADGKYILANISTGESFTLTTSENGDILSTDKIE